MRAGIDVSEIEAQTKIRAKYLRALENEEWGLLPGPTYVRSFLRTYAQALGLDSKALLDEYSAQYEAPREAELAQMRRTASQRGRDQSRGRPPRSRGFVIAVGALVVLIVVLLVSLLGGGGSGKKAATTSTVARTPRPQRATPARPAASARMSLQLMPQSSVYVCLIGDGGRKLVDKLILTPTSPEPVYHAHRFTITLGNSSITLRLDGRTLTVPPSSNATGYVITRRGRRTLPLGQLPTCA